MYEWEIHDYGSRENDAVLSARGVGYLLTMISDECAALKSISTAIKPPTASTNT